MKHGIAALAFAALASVAGGQEEEQRGLVSRAEGAFDGYTLFAPLRSTTTYLVDMAGEVVHTWESEHFPGNSVYLRDDGNLFRACRMKNDRYEGGGQGGRIQELTWDGKVVWDFAFNNEDHMHHHDYEPLPNGNLLLIAWEGKSKEEAFAAGRDPEHIGTLGFWPDFIVEIEPVRPDGGKVVWEWHAWDHLIQDFNRGRANFGDVTAHPELIDINGDHRDEPPLSEEERKRQEELEREMRALGYTGDDDDDKDEKPESGGRPFKGDWLHTNSIDYLAEHDLIALSVHRFSELWVIDHSTTTAEAAGHSGGRYGRGGDLLYRWGNPRMHGHGTEADQKLFRQHDARWITSGRDLRLLAFNNGRGRPDGDYSSVDEILLPFDAEGGFASGAGAFAPAKPAWTYTAPDRTSFYSSFISGAQRLPNGNTLICSGAQGRLFEVTRAGEIVWEYLNPFGEEKPGEGGPKIPKGLFRATRLPADHPGLARL